jgi:sugar lactone lactonase YvrE
MEKAVLFIAMLLTCCKLDRREAVSVYAGSQVAGFANGDSDNASFSSPTGIATDSLGNIYVADSHNHAIRKIDVEGRVTTIAGTGKPGADDGPSHSASFFFPTALAVDGSGNIYVADTRNHLVRRITADGGVTTIACKDRPFFQNPEGIAVDQRGNVFVTDHTDRIYRISDAGKVSIYAGSGVPGWLDGDSTTARFYVPRGIALDRAGNLYVADCFNNRIRKIDKNRRVSTLAGSNKKGRSDGLGDSAGFFHPTGIAVDGHQIFVTDMNNQTIRRIDFQGRVSTLAGNGTRGVTNAALKESSFWNPIGVTVSDGNLFVSDNLNNLIRRIEQR